MTDMDKGATQNSAECEHEWVWLRKSDIYEKAYRVFAHEDWYYCKKCLAQRGIELEHKRLGRSSGSW